MGIAVSTSSTVAPGIVPVSVTQSRDLVDTDFGAVLNCTAALTLNIPVGLPVGFSCAIVQAGASQVTVTAATGVTLSNANSQTKTSGQNSAVGLISNGLGSYILTGATGP